MDAQYFGSIDTSVTSGVQLYWMYVSSGIVLTWVSSVALFYQLHFMYHLRGRRLFNSGVAAVAFSSTGCTTSDLINYDEMIC